MATTVGKPRSVAPHEFLPVPYAEVVRLLNHSYRGTRWHSASVAPPTSDFMRSVEVGPIRIDFFQAGQISLVMPRPTDWLSLHSVLPNICLPKDAFIAAAVDKATRQLSGYVEGDERIAVIGFSQAGYIAIRLSASLLAAWPAMKGRVSAITFNSAPYEGPPEPLVGEFVTNYRTVLGQSAANRLGYRAGDYVSLLGPLPGRTFEVEIQPAGPALSPRKFASISYLALHADPYLIAKSQADWVLKDISLAARNNPGLALSRHLQKGWDGPCALPDQIAKIGRALMDDAQARPNGIDPCLAAQLENIVGFADAKPRSVRWSLLKAMAALALRHSRTPTAWAVLERLLGRSAIGAAWLIRHTRPSPP